MKPEDRYRYEIAEHELDEFARYAVSMTFKRSYRRFKGMVAAVAWSDFLTPDVSADQALAWAWEDAEMAFIGRGEPCLTGAIVQMWLWLRSEERERFKKVVKQAFADATASTSLNVPRRFTSHWRNQSLRTPEEGFNLPTVLPCWGPTLRDWAIDSHEDPDQLERQFALLELGDREMQRRQEEEK